MVKKLSFVLHGSFMSMPSISVDLTIIKPENYWFWLLRLIIELPIGVIYDTIIMNFIKISKFGKLNCHKKWIIVDFTISINHQLWIISL